MIEHDPAPPADTNHYFQFERRKRRIKHLKKLASLVLALAMALALAVPAFAADNPGKITVENPVAGSTYTAYKIFDVVYSSEQNPTNYSYTITKDSPWYDTVAAYATSTVEKDQEGNDVVKFTNGLELRETTVADTYTVYVYDNFSAADFTNALSSALKTMSPAPSGTDLTENSETKAVEATNLELGYYFVTSTTGALCNLTTTNPEAEIKDKNDVKFDKTDDKVDIEGVQIGDTINYTIQGIVPNTAGFSEYKYIVSDTMSEGLTFNADSLKIYVTDANVITPAEDGAAAVVPENTPELDSEYYVLTNKQSDPPTTTDFTIAFKTLDMNKDGMAGKTISIVYTATVNDKAVAHVEKNKAELVYTNNPDGNTDTKTDEEWVYSAQIVIDKIDGENKDAEGNPIKLAGAEFVLKKVVQDAEGKDKDLFYKATFGADGKTVTKVEWVEDQVDATVVTTDENGAANFPGLAKGTYYLVETKAPAGFNLLKEPVKVEVTGNQTTTTGDVTADKTDDEGNAMNVVDEANQADRTEGANASLKYVSQVENSTGSLLPETGGIGTTIFYIVGGILVAGAGILLITKRRMNTNTED